MGAQHTATLGKKLQLAAKGRLCVIASYVNEKYEGENPSRRYGLLDRKDGSTLASMTIQTLPGCCGVLVLHSFQGKPENVVKFIDIAKV